MLTIHDLKDNVAPLIGNGEIAYDRKLNAVDQITTTLYNWPENKLSYPMITERAILELPNGQLFRILTRSESSLGELKAWDVTALHVLHDLNDKLLHNKDKKNKPDEGDEDEEPQGVTLTLDDCMAYITDGTKFTYDIDGDFGTHTFADMPEGKALDIFLNTLIPTYQFEFIADNYHIHIQRQIGSENAFVFVDNGNISAIKAQYDDTNLATHIMGECKPLVTEDDVTSAEKAVEDAKKSVDSSQTTIDNQKKTIANTQAAQKKKDDAYPASLAKKQKAIADAKQRVVDLQKALAKWQADYAAKGKPVPADTLKNKQQTIANAQKSVTTLTNSLATWQKNQATASEKSKETLKKQQDKLAEYNTKQAELQKKYADKQAKYEKNKQVYTDSGADGDVITAEYTSPNASIYSVIDADYFVDDDAHTKSALQQDLPLHLQDTPKMSLTLEYHEFADNATIRSIDDVEVGNSGWIRDRFDIDISSRVVEMITYLDSPGGHEPELTFGNVIGDFATIMAHLSNVSSSLANAGGTAMPGEVQGNAAVLNFFQNASWTKEDVSDYVGRS